MAKIDVHGLTEEEKETLKQLALQHTGKANISGFVKQWLRAQRDKPTIPKLYPTIPAASTQQKTMRLELKLPPHIADYLTQGAKIGKMSANRYALAILAGYIDQHPILTGNEVTALYQSNYQLVKIGNNLNQIARKLNAGETASLTSQNIAELAAFIDQHTDKVGELIRQYRKRTQR